MADEPQIDPVKLKEEIKAEAVKEAQQELINRLQGNKKTYSWEERGKTAPESYDELFSEVKKNIPTLSQDEIDARVDAKLQEKENARLESEKEEKKQKDADLESKRKSFDAEWYQLVQEGKMPQVDAKLQDRINKGEELTKDEIMADKGLKARLELAQVAVNKSAKLAFYEDYNKEQPGAHAPVFGNRPSSPHQESQELDYDKDVKPNRKRIFGF